MRKQIQFVGLVLIALSLAAGSAAAQTMTEDAAKKSAMKMAGKEGAMAVLTTTDGSNKVIGAVGFAKKGDKVQVKGTFEGLTPGKHGFHVHEVGNCGPKDGKPAEAAGPHFNPKTQPHADRTDAARHVGDLGNIEANASGKAKINVGDSMVKLDGADSIVGRAVIVHANPDDLKTQPSGNAGSRYACGVVMMATPMKK